MDERYAAAEKGFDIAIYMTLERVNYFQENRTDEKRNF